MKKLSEELSTNDDPYAENSASANSVSNYVI